MLNILWPAFIIVSFSFAIFTGNLNNLNESIFSSTKEVVNLSITLIGSICLWNGIMRIASKTSIIKRLSLILEPLIKYLFPEVCDDLEIRNVISMNIVSNMMGLGNAATPLGIKAMKMLQNKNINKDRLSNSMAILIVLNTASIQIIPTTVISIRSSFESINPTIIIVPIWIATISAAFVAIFITKMFIKCGK